MRVLELTFKFMPNKNQSHKQITGMITDDFPIYYKIKKPEKKRLKTLQNCKYYVLLDIGLQLEKLRMRRINSSWIIIGIICLSLLGARPAFSEELTFEEQSELNSYSAQRAYKYKSVELRKKRPGIAECTFGLEKRAPQRAYWERIRPQRYLLYRKDDPQKKPKAFLQIKDDGSASVNEPCLRFGSKPLTVELCTRYFGNPRVSDNLYVFDLATDEFGESNVFHLDMIFNSKKILEKYRVRGMGITNTELVTISGET